MLFLHFSEIRNEKLTTIADTKTSPEARKKLLQKLIHPEHEIMKTWQGERITIYSIPSVPPKGEEKKIFFLLIQIYKYFACICNTKLIYSKLVMM